MTHLGTRITLIVFLLIICGSLFDYFVSNIAISWNLLRHLHELLLASRLWTSTLIDCWEECTWEFILFSKSLEILTLLGAHSILRVLTKLWVRIINESCAAWAYNLEVGILPTVWEVLVCCSLISIERATIWSVITIDTLIKKVLSHGFVQDPSALEESCVCLGTYSTIRHLHFAVIWTFILLVCLIYPTSNTTFTILRICSLILWSKLSLLSSWVSLTYRPLKKPRNRFLSWLVLRSAILELTCLWWLILLLLIVIIPL